MNKIIYNLFVVFFIGSFGLMAQSQKKYQKNFTVDKNTKLKFETRNIDVTFKIWNRDEVKVDFVVDFKNYSEEEIKHVSNGIVVVATMQSTMGDSNYLLIKNASPTSIGKLSYQLKEGEIHIENMSWEKDEPNKYRTVKDINKEISGDSNDFYDLDGYVVFKNDSVALKDIKNSNHRKIQSISSSYEIYLPAYMMMDIMANQANINFDGKFTNHIQGAFYDSQLRASEFDNENNSFTFINGSVKVKKIKGGSFAFKNVTNGLLGQLENVMMQTEFSKFNIGEITKNVQFKDFKSNFFIYNLGENFELINMVCEYSDIKMYAIKDQKYFMEAVGNNAVLNDHGTKIIMQPNRDGKKFKMFTRGKDDVATRKNTFKLDLIHGFVSLFYNN
ncbi:hypothetical protein [Kordia sp.]|uniref:hypothetical protein n=1 Tax=Kordia sp. TaxID=1965332 RepID=UPI003D28BBE3